MLSTLYVLISLNSGDEHRCRPPSTNSGGRVPPFTSDLHLWLVLCLTYIAQCYAYYEDFNEMYVFFSTCNIASASAFYLSRPQKNPQKHPHFTRLKIRKSADPHFTEALTRSFTSCITAAHIVTLLSPAWQWLCIPVYKLGLHCIFWSHTLFLTILVYGGSLRPYSLYVHYWWSNLFVLKSIAAETSAKPLGLYMYLEKIKNHIIEYRCSCADLCNFIVIRMSKCSLICVGL